MRKIVVRINSQKLSSKVLKPISRIASPDVPRDLSELHHVTTKRGRSRAVQQKFHNFWKFANTAHFCAEPASAVAARDKVLEHVVESLKEENVEQCEKPLTLAVKALAHT